MASAWPLTLSSGCLDSISFGLITLPGHRGRASLLIITLQGFQVEIHKFGARLEALSFDEARAQQLEATVAAEKLAVRSAKETVDELASQLASAFFPSFDPFHFM